MPPFINGVDIGRKMTADEVAALHRSGRLKGITLQGYFWRHEMDGLGSWVHFTDPTANKIGEPGGGLRNFAMQDPVPAMRAAVEAEAPIVKRTPQQRLASMTARLMQGNMGQEAAALVLMQMLRGNAAANGLTDEQVKAISGASWEKGDPLSAETVRNVAAHFLGTAEKKAAQAARETTTRAGRKAQREQERLEAAERRRWERQAKKG